MTHHPFVPLLSPIHFVPATDNHTSLSATIAASSTSGTASYLLGPRIYIGTNYPSGARAAAAVEEVVVVLELGGSETVNSKSPFSTSSRRLDHFLGMFFVPSNGVRGWIGGFPLCTRVSRRCCPVGWGGSPGLASMKCVSYDLFDVGKGSENTGKNLV